MEGALFLSSRVELLDIKETIETEENDFYFSNLSTINYDQTIKKSNKF